MKKQRPPPAAEGDKPPPKVPKPASKAERRALQEAQRAAKAAAKADGAGGGGNTSDASGGRTPTRGGPSSAQQPGGGGGGGSSATSAARGAHGDAGGSHAHEQRSGAAAGAAAAGSTTPTGVTSAGGPASDQQQLQHHRSSGAQGIVNSGRGQQHALRSPQLFAHLQQYRRISVESALRGDGAAVHPAVLELGLRYADGSVTGATARCVALLHALAAVISDYHTPPGKSLHRDLMACINASVDFLVRCRPLGVAMGNAIRALKVALSRVDPAGARWGLCCQGLQQHTQVVWLWLGW